MRQLPLPMRLRASSVFATFHAAANSPVVMHLQALLSTPPTDGRPSSKLTWLHGPTAVGKTHLLQAVCAQAGQQGGSAAYFPLRERERDPQLLQGCELLQFVCLDDFAGVAGDPEWERAVFRLYSEMEDQPGRIVIAAELPPQALAIRLRDLASRLAAATIFRLAPLDDAGLAVALRMRAEQLGLQLPDETTQYVLTRLPRDMASLSAALDRLDQASLASQRRLTVPFVREVLEI